MRIEVKMKNGFILLSCDLWTTILHKLVNAGFDLRRIKDLRIFVDNKEIPKPKRYKTGE